MNTLGPRETDVLTTIIENYIATSLPVGSRTVASASRLKLSPQSMRNTMAELTDQGYLEQPHTSAGRVPTPRAFRLYVDRLLRVYPLPATDQHAIHDALTCKSPEVGALLRRASAMLSGHARQVAMVVAPSADDARLRSLDFVPAAEGLVLAVLVLQGGLTRTRIVPMTERYDASELVRFGNYLNTHFRGLTLTEVRNRIQRELSGEEQRLEHMYRQALRLSGAALASMDDERELFVNGTANMAEHAEFADMSRMRELLDALEERTRLLELLDRTILQEDVTVTFCQDAHLDALRGCSVVSMPYGGDHRLGVISVIGPVRMDYSRVVPLMEYMARALTGIITDRFAGA